MIEQCAITLIKTYYSRYRIAGDIIVSVTFDSCLLSVTSNAFIIVRFRPYGYCTFVSRMYLSKTKHVSS